MPSLLPATSVATQPLDQPRLGRGQQFREHGEVAASFIR
jgi:hypothetical protein